VARQGGLARALRGLRRPRAWGHGANRLARRSTERGVQLLARLASLVSERERAYQRKLQGVPVRCNASFGCILRRVAAPRRLRVRACRPTTQLRCSWAGVRGADLSMPRSPNAGPRPWCRRRGTSDEGAFVRRRRSRGLGADRLERPRPLTFQRGTPREQRPDFRTTEVLYDKVVARQGERARARRGLHRPRA